MMSVSTSGQRTHRAVQVGWAFWETRCWQPARRCTLLHGDRVLPPIAATLILVAIFFPFWNLKLHAPQYINGLQATIWFNRVTGDVAEIDGLNHYIGMRPLADGGATERQLAVFAVPVMAGLAALSGLRRRWMWLLALPAIAFPVVFVVDLFYWLYTFGNNLDPTAALSSSIKEFTPTIFGQGKVGQFRTSAMFVTGFWLSAFAAWLLLLSLISRHWKSRQQV